jgi:anti-sigma factor RsiW
MNECHRTADRLTPYVDETLPAAERAEVDAHLDACPPCRAAAIQEAGGRAVLRERAVQLRSLPLPPGLRTRCLAHARDAARPPVSGWRARLVPAILTAVLVLFTVGAVVSLATQRSNTLLAAQLTADHDRCFRRVGPMSAGLDAPAEERRLADAFGWDVHIPPSSAAHGVRLVGARRCLYAQGTVPHLLYEATGHPLSLYILEGVARPGGEVTAFGHRARIWSRGATTFVLLSPASAGELAPAVAYVRQEAH